MKKLAILSILLVTFSCGLNNQSNNDKKIRKKFYAKSKDFRARSKRNG